MKTTTRSDGAGMELFPTTTSSFFAVGGDGTRTEAQWLIYRPPNGKFRYVLVSVLRRKLGNLIKKDRRYRGRLELEKLTWIDETYYDFDTAAWRAVKDYLSEDLCRRALGVSNWKFHLKFPVADPRHSH